MKRLLLNLALLCWATSQALSAAQATDWTVETLMRAMAGAQSHHTHFTETREMTLLQQSLTSRGILTFERPDRLIKQFDPPDGLRYEIDAKRLLIRRSDGTEEIIRLDNAPQLLAFVSAMRAVLAGDLNGLRDHFTLDMQGGRQAWRMRLSPKSGLLARQVRHIEITGSDSRIETFLVEEQAGDRTLMRLHDADGG